MVVGHEPEIQPSSLDSSNPETSTTTGNATQHETCNPSSQTHQLAWTPIPKSNTRHVSSPVRAFFISTIDRTLPQEHYPRRRDLYLLGAATTRILEIKLGGAWVSGLFWGLCMGRWLRGDRSRRRWRLCGKGFGVSPNILPPILLSIGDP
jgi:hypothetical protein